MIHRENLRVKWVLRKDTIQGFYRVARIMWEVGNPGFRGHSCKFTVALDPKLFRWWRRDAITDWRITILGVRLHYCRSYGGTFV
jgi:hypothetical protein